MKRNLTSVFLGALLWLVGISAWAIEPVDGVYQIATPQDFVEFSALVNGGQGEINAVLTADIDMSTVDNLAPIGQNGATLYAGTFDGQNHKISNLTIDYPETDNVGLFNVAKATLQNFYLDETCKITGKGNVALVGWANADGPKVKNVGIAATITGTGDNISSFFGRMWKNAAIEDCWTVANIQNGNSNTGAFIGWCSNWAGTITNSYADVTFAIAPAAGNYLARKSDNVTFTNVFTTGESTRGTKIDKADVASGALCYNMNLAAGENIFFQKIGEDTYPMRDPSRGIVYKTGKVRCDGVDVPGETIYTNTDPSTGVTVPDHQFVDGICTVCNSWDPSYLVDGIYQLSLPKHLAWFSWFVNSGHFDANAVLLADLDMSEITDFMPIGGMTNEANDKYHGKFDGQGHTISNLVLSYPEATGVGLFNTGGDNSHVYISNLTLDKTCIFDGTSMVGMIGNHNHGDATFENLGSMATITGVQNTSPLIGRAWATGSNVITMSNCWSVGEVFTDSSCGALCGWASGAASYKVTNCWTACVIQGNNMHNVVRAQEAGAVTFDNCYALNQMQAGVKNIVPEDIANGALCFALNQGVFINPTWYQHVGADEYPTLRPGYVVYETPDGYGSFIPEDEMSFQAFREEMVSMELTRIGETVADQSLLDTLQVQVESWADCANFDAFVAAYMSVQSLKAQIEASKEVYNKYKDACEYAIQYLQENNFTSALRTVLEKYLNEDKDPSPKYPNGTYKYIIATHMLSDEQVTAETEYVNEMLTKAIASNIVPGTEITVTIPNYDFKAGLENWTVEAENPAGVTVSDDASVMAVAQASNTTFSVSQTITDVPNGIYMVSVNGFSRAGIDFTNKLYSGEVFVNGNKNFLASQGEDVVSKDDAQDGVNCLLSGKTPDVEFVYEDTEGYVPNALAGCPYAFKAGRYLNIVAAEVKDSTLQFGVRNPGSGLEEDWTPFGNFRVTYLGSAEQGSEALSTVLASVVARAQTISNFEWSEGEYNKYPNFSEELKDKIIALLSEAETAEDGAKKMSLINEFSQAFGQVYDCRQAYVKMVFAADELSDKATTMYENKLIGDSLYQVCLITADEGYAAYIDGSANTEQALQITQKLRDVLGNIGIRRNDDGFYELANGRDMILFSMQVARGETDANAVLTADIDMKDVENFTPIGNNDGTLYAGTFDGQGHKISNLTISMPETQNVGLFNTGNATLKNFWLDETCTIEGKSNVGLVGWINAPNGAKFEKVGNAATIIGGENSSGFIGRAWKNTVLTDCWTIATVKNTSSTTGSFVGWMSNWGATLTNCWTACTFDIAPAAGNYVCRNGGTYVNTYANGGTQGTLMQQADVASGALCYNLNQGAGETVWYQTLGVDPYPVLDPTHKVVLKADDGTYYNEADGIVEVTTGENVRKKNVIYDLSGRRIGGGVLPKGIYVVNGRKILVR